VTEEPICTKAPQHYWHELGVEDNGEVVHRCGNCLVLKYVGENDEVRYEVPQA